MNNPPKRQRTPIKQLRTQTHDWPLGAIAELVSQAANHASNNLISSPNHQSKYQPAVHIDTHTTEDDEPYFTIRSTGQSLSLATLHSRILVTNPVKSWANNGSYANPWQAAALRLAAEVMIITRDPNQSSAKVALLSRARVLDLQPDAPAPIPLILDWPLQSSTSHLLAEFLANSPIETEQLTKYVDSLSNGGTLVLLFSLRRSVENACTELDTTTDIHDIRMTSTSTSSTPTKQLSTSLRTYLELLFLRPSFRIYLRGTIVRERCLRRNLVGRYQCTYEPSGRNKGTKVVSPASFSFGFDFDTTASEFGIFIYSKGRLVVPQFKLGLHEYMNSEVRMIGIVEADFLTPTPNWQYFHRDKLYKRVIHAVNDSLTDFWSKYNSFDTIKAKHSTDVVTNWARCDECLKWRIVGQDAPDPHDWNCVKWVCSMNNGGTNTCLSPDDEEDEPLSANKLSKLSQPTLPSPIENKKRIRNEKLSLDQHKKKKERNDKSQNEKKVNKVNATPLQTVSVGPQLDLDGPTPELVAADGMVISTENFSLSSSPQLTGNKFRRSEGMNLLAKAAAAEPLCSTDTPQIKYRTPKSPSDGPVLIASLYGSDVKARKSSKYKRKEQDKKNGITTQLSVVSSPIIENLLSRQVRRDSPSNKNHDLPAITNEPNNLNALEISKDRIRDGLNSDQKALRRQETFRKQDYPALFRNRKRNKGDDARNNRSPNKLVELDTGTSPVRQCDYKEHFRDHSTEKSGDHIDTRSILCGRDTNVVKGTLEGVISSQLNADCKDTNSKGPHDNPTPEPASSAGGTPLDPGLQDRLTCDQFTDDTAGQSRPEKSFLGKDMDKANCNDDLELIQENSGQTRSLPEATQTPTGSMTGKQPTISSTPVKENARATSDMDQTNTQPRTTNADNVDNVHNVKSLNMRDVQSKKPSPSRQSKSTNNVQIPSTQKTSVPISSPVSRKVNPSSGPNLENSGTEPFHNNEGNQEGDACFHAGSPPGYNSNQLLTDSHYNIFATTPLQSMGLTRDPFDLTTPRGTNIRQASPRGSQDLLDLNLHRPGPMNDLSSPSARFRDVTFEPPLNTRQPTEMDVPAATNAEQGASVSNDQNQFFSGNFVSRPIDTLAISREAIACATRTLLPSMQNRHLFTDNPMASQDGHTTPNTDTINQQLSAPAHCPNPMENGRTPDFAGLPGVSQLTFSAAIAGAAAAAAAINSNQLRQKHIGISDTSNFRFGDNVDAALSKDLADKLDEEKRKNESLRSKLQELVCLVAPGTGGGASSWARNIEELDVRQFAKEINETVTSKAREAAEREQLEEMERYQASQQIACKNLEKLRRLVRVYLDQVVGIYHPNDSEEPIEVQFEECLRTLGALQSNNT